MDTGIGYPTERVECHRCDGCGRVETDEVDFGFEGMEVACGECGGSGWVDVCENCYDAWDGCTVCRPETTGARAQAGATQEGNGLAG